MSELESERFDFTAPPEHDRPSKHCTRPVLEQKGNYVQKQESGLAGLLFL